MTTIGQEDEGKQLALRCFDSSFQPHFRHSLNFCATMPRLRMKDTPEDIEAILKAERRQRKKRRREEERTREDKGDSMTPPRASTSRLYNDDGFDESQLPPHQARKVDFDTSRDFEDRLRDAMDEDEGVGLREELLYSREASRTAASFSYGGAAGIALGFGRSGVEAMDEEEYAEHVRAGMWRLKNKDEAERRDAIVAAHKAKEEKERVENDLRKKVEREKIKKLEEKIKKRNMKEEKDARERYEEQWKKVLSTPAHKSAPPVPIVSEELEEGPQPAVPHPHPLRFTDFPWPLYPSVPFPPLSWPASSDITATTINLFLTSHVAPEKKKSVLRSAVLAYHPDRFDRLLNRIPEDKEEVRERVKELGLRVSQVLNDLLKAAGGNGK